MSNIYVSYWGIGCFHIEPNAQYCAVHGLHKNEIKRIIMRLSVLSSWFLSEQGYQSLRKAVILCLLAGSCYQLAALSWIFFTNSHVTTDLSTLTSTTTDTSASNARQALLNNLQQAALFGVEKDPNGGQLAPKSTLNATVTGILASNTPERSLAIIQSNGGQATYNLGDVIAGTHAKIKAIYPNRVIIVRQNQEEALFLDEDSPTSSSADSVGPEEHRPLTKIRQEILKRPQQLLDYIHITPIMDDDEELQGYRINPGSHADAFDQLGLQPNDVAISLNGYNLKDRTEAVEAIQQLSRKTEFNITVVRGGKPQDIYINLTQP